MLTYVTWWVFDMLVATTRATKTLRTIIRFTQKYTPTFHSGKWGYIFHRMVGGTTMRCPKP